MRYDYWVLDGEKVLITGATGKIAFPIARALAGRNDVWGAARLKHRADRDRLDGSGRHTVRPRHGRSATSRRCPTISTTCSMRRSTPAPMTGPRAFRRTRTIPVRCLRIAVRQRGSFSARRVRSTAIKVSGRYAKPIRRGYRFDPTTASRKIAAESVCTWVADRYQHPVDHHPHLLDVRARGRRARRPPGNDVGGQARFGFIPTSPTTTTRSTKTTTSNSASAPWRSQPLPRSS